MHPQTRQIRNPYHELIMNTILILFIHYSEPPQQQLINTQCCVQYFVRVCVYGCERERMREKKGARVC